MMLFRHMKSGSTIRNHRNNIKIFLGKYLIENDKDNGQILTPLHPYSFTCVMKMHFKRKSAISER